MDPITFLQENNIDEKASEIFIAADPEVQAAAMERGDLKDARNPSAALLGRLRQAKGAAVPQVDVDAFIAENELDDRAAESLRSSNPAVQQVVMSRGDLKDARNPSAALLGRIKDANNSGAAQMAMWGSSGGKSYGGGGKGGGGGFARKGDVEKWAAENMLDERAAEALMECSPQVQHAVMERGGVSETRNPSACVLGRIRDAKGGMGGGSKGEWGGGYGPMGGCGGGFGGGEMGGMMGMMMQMMKGMGGKGGGKGGGMMGGGMMMGGKGGFGGKGGGGKGGKAVQSFIAMNNIDDAAASAFMSEAPHVQEAVMSRGSLAETNNPSAALLGRIRQAKRDSPY